MKAVFVNTSRNWGGGERWFLWAAQALDSLGHGVVLVTAKGSCLEDRAGGESIRLCSLSSGATLPLGLCRLFRRFRPGVVLCNSGAEVRAAVLARFGSTKPAIIFRRGLCRALGRSVFHRWFYRRTDAFLCNSRATLDLVKNSAPDLAESRIKVMYNPAPPQEPAGEDEIAAWRRRLLLKPGELLVLSVGRLAPEKGHRYLLEAFRILLRTHAASRLVIAGGGAELENLEFVASELGISERVSLPGFVVALTPLYRLADMVVQPSLPGYESFSNAALEALSHGLPIIATTAGGFPELIEQGKDGLLVPHSDVNALAHAMIRLADSKQLRSNLGSAAKRKIQADFAPEKKAGELEHYLCAFSGSAHEDCPKATSRDL